MSMVLSEKHCVSSFSTGSADASRSLRATSSRAFALPSALLLQSNSPLARRPAGVSASALWLSPSSTTRSFRLASVPCPGYSKSPIFVDAWLTIQSGRDHEHRDPCQSHFSHHDGFMACQLYDRSGVAHRLYANWVAILSGLYRLLIHQRDRLLLLVPGDKGGFCLTGDHV